MNLMTLLMSNTAASGSAGGQQSNPFSMLIIMGIMFGALYIFMIRPQKKKQKEEQQMRDSLQIGDEITTIGGIVGRVVTIKDDSLIIETGADRNKMKITRWAIQTNNTASEKAEAERVAAAEAKKAERDAKIEEEGKKFAKKKKKKSDEE